MRNFINIITESVGLANRRTGESFINDKGDLLTFVGLNFYPTEGKFDDTTDLKNQVANIESRTANKIEFTNQAAAKMLAFGVATFKDPNGSIVLFGRYFASINSIFTGNYWPNSGLPNGFRYNKSSATKMQSGLMPQDVLTKMDNLTPEDILEQVVSKFGPTHPLSHLTNGISKGQSLPIFIDVTESDNISFEGFRDYFCEILQPIAVMNSLTTGNAQEAIDVFFGKQGLKGCTITFGSGKNVGLYDSLLISPSGKQIKISTKGKGGATASVGNLIEAVKELELTGNTELRNQYKDIIDIIETVQKNGYAEGPLLLAEQFGIISGKESAIVRSLKKADKTPLTKTLQKLYDGRAATADQTKLVPYYNMLAAIAYSVAEYINENTNFEKGAADILNHSALIQVYTTATQKDSRIILQQFKSVYPSTLVSGVQFSAHKTYFSSGNKGNFTFKLLSNGATGDSLPTAASLSDIKDTTAKKITHALNPHVNVRPPGASEVPREKRIAPPREKRK